MKELTSNYLDGGLAPDQEAELIAALKADPANLRTFVEQAMFEQQIREAVEASAGMHGGHAFLPASMTAPVRHSAWKKFSLIAAMIALVAVPVAFVLRSAQKGEQVVTIRDIYGSLSWSGSDGRTVTDISVGDRFPAGSFESLGEGSRALMVFKDKSQLTIGGDTRATVSDNEQKVIRLGYGSIRAEVTPQPADKPMLVVTPTAQVDVVGTVFSVTSEDELTTMNVETGLVKMHRLADGETVEIPETHSASASLDSSAPFFASKYVGAGNEWKLDLSAQSQTGISGLSALDETGAPILKGVPAVVGREKDSGKLIIHYGVAIMDPLRSNNQTFVSVTPDSVLRFRYRSAIPCHLFIYCSAQQGSPSFRGNFRLFIPNQPGTQASDEWKEVSVPLSQLKHDRLDSTMFSGNALIALSIRSFSQDALLEFSNISVVPGQP